MVEGNNKSQAHTHTGTLSYRRAVKTVDREIEENKTTQTENINSFK